jgi:hypothetical protein
LELLDSDTFRNSPFLTAARSGAFAQRCGDAMLPLGEFPLRGFDVAHAAFGVHE